MKTALTLLIGVALISGAAAANLPWCQTNRTTYTPSLYSMYGEFQSHNLGDYIQGYNLTYSLKDPVSDHTIVNAFMKVSEQSQVFASEKVASAKYVLSDVSIQYALLSKFRGKYVVNPSVAMLNEAPKFSIQINIQQNVTRCYDILMVNSTVAALYCIDLLYDKGYTHNMILVNIKTGQQSQFYIGMVEGLTDFPDQAKINWYRNARGEQFLASAVLYDNPAKLQAGANTVSQYVLNLFQYFNDVPDVFPLGYFMLQPPITAQTLSLKTLQIIDIGVAQGQLFLLDYQQGLFYFSFLHKQVQDIQSFYPGYQYYWGMSLVNENTFCYLTIMTTSNLLEYRMDSNNLIQLRQKTNVDITLLSHTKIQTNDNYAILSVSQILIMVERQQQMRSSLVFSERFVDMRTYELVGSGSLLVFYDDHAANYQLQIPQLQIHPSISTSQIYSLLIIADSVEFGQSTQCQLTIQSSFISALNSKNYFYSGRPFPFANNSYINGDSGHRIELGQDLVGPNIQYAVVAPGEDEPNGDFRYEVRGPARLPVKIDTADWSNIIFSQVKVVDESQFYLVVQDKDFLVRIYSCRSSRFEDAAPVDCGSKPQAQTSLNNKISAWNSVRWYNQDTWMFIDLYNVIYLNDYYGYAIASFANYAEAYQIMDVRVAQNQIFILYQNAKQEAWIDFRSFDIDFRLISQINQNTFPDQRFSGQFWNPQNIYTSELLPSTLIMYLKVEEQVYLVGAKFTEGSFQLLYNMWFDERFTAHLFGVKLIIDFYQSNRIAVYDISRPPAIIFEKVLPLYGTSLTRQYRAVISRMGVLYAIVNETMVNVYDLQKPVFDTLLYQQTVPAGPSRAKGLKEDYTQQYMSVDGFRGAEILATILDGQLSIYRIPRAQQIAITADIPKHTYISQGSFQLIATSWDSAIQSLTTYQVNGLNQETRPQMNHDYIAQSGVQSSLYIPAEDKPVTYALEDSEWCKGSVFRYNVSCPQSADCGKQVKLANKLEEILSDVGYIPDAVDFNYDKVSMHVFILSLTKVYVYTNDFSLVQVPIDLGIDPSEYRCTQMVQGRDYRQNLKYQFVFCQNIKDPKNTHYSLITIDITQQDPVVSKPIEMSQIQGLGKVIPFYNMNDQILLIDELASGTLFMFKLDYSAVQLDLLYSFNSSYFSASPASNFVTFQVLQTSESDICIVLVDQLMRMFALNIKDISSQVFIQFDFRQWLADQSLYFNNQTYIVDLALWQLSLSSNQDIIAKTLIVTNNTPMYDVIMTVPSQGSMSVQLYALFNNYGDQYQPFGQIRTSGQSFAIVYSNIRSRQSILAVYEQYGSEGEEHKTEASRPLSQFNGAFWYQNIPPQNASYNFCFFTGKYGQQLILSANPLNGEIDLISYQKKMTFQIATNKVAPQNVTFTAVSDNTEATDSFDSYLNFKPAQQMQYEQQ